MDQALSVRRVPRAALRAVIARVTTPATVQHVEHLTPRMRRIRLAGDALRDLAWTPGQHVRVQVCDVREPGTSLRDLLRTYSIWAGEPDGTLDLCVLDHPAGGPGATWARQVRPGARVSFLGPQGRFVLRPDAAYHVFIGDETASVAFGSMLRVLGADEPAHGVVQVSSAADQLTFPRAEELLWIHNGEASTDAGRLVDAVRSLPLPDEPGVAYVAGEAGSCQAVALHLVRERGWPRRAVLTKPFWAPGKRGLD
jgi:NADPH-dependent ferric siderophore reductase